MALAFTIVSFTFDRVRTVLLALSFIIMLKVGWVLVAPAILG
jgi:hypothetical protein